MGQELPPPPSHHCRNPALTSHELGPAFPCRVYMQIWQFTISQQSRMVPSLTRTVTHVKPNARNVRVSQSQLRHCAVEHAMFPHVGRPQAPTNQKQTSIEPHVPQQPQHTQNQAPGPTLATHHQLTPNLRNRSFCQHSSQRMSKVGHMNRSFAQRDPCDSTCSVVTSKGLGNSLELLGSLLSWGIWIPLAP